MQAHFMIYKFLIDGEEVEIKAESQYAAKRIAKRRAGPGIDCIYIGKREWKVKYDRMD